MLKRSYCLKDVGSISVSLEIAQASLKSNISGLLDVDTATVFTSNLIESPCISHNT